MYFNKIKKVIICSIIGALIIGTCETIYNENVAYGSWNSRIHLINFEKSFWDKIFNSFYCTSGEYANPNFDWKEYIKNNNIKADLSPLIWDAKCEKQARYLIIKDFQEDKAFNTMRSAKPTHRILASILAISLQPFHLILGFFLFKTLISIIANLKNYFLPKINRLFFILRGIYRTIAEKLTTKIKDYENKGRD